jgi:hypothetical protein
MKSKEKINQAFTKYFYTESTEQASSLAFGVTPPADQGTPLIPEDGAIAIPEDNPTFDEAVSQPIPLKLWMKQ